MSAVSRTANPSGRPRYAWLATMVLALSVLVGTAVACGRATGTPAATKPTPAPTASATATPAPATAPASVPAPAPGPALARKPVAGRLVAIGDLHGNLEAARAALRLAGAIDDQDHWIGGSLTIVQTGDEVDRGGQEQAVIDLFERLTGEAAKAGGAVIPMIGNHEFFNVSGNFFSSTPEGLADFDDVPGLDRHDPRLAAYSPQARARAAALLPGGPYARILARRPAIALVGDTLFFHGGFLPEHLQYGVERLNRELAAWMNGTGEAPPAWMAKRKGPLGSRRYSDPPSEAPCDEAAAVLSALGARRMVMGHTIQEQGITSACNGALWMIDVGLATRSSGRVEVLEIDGQGHVQPLSRPW